MRCNHLYTSFFLPLSSGRIASFCTRIFFSSSFFSLLYLFSDMHALALMSWENLCICICTWIFARLIWLSHFWYILNVPIFFSFFFVFFKWTKWSGKTTNYDFLSYQRCKIKKNKNKRLVSKNERKTKWSVSFHFVFDLNEPIRNATKEEEKWKEIYTYIVIDVFVFMTSQFVYAYSWGCNWLIIAVTKVVAAIMWTEIMPCILIVLVYWISKCGTTQSSWCKDDELKWKHSNGGNTF